MITSSQHGAAPAGGHIASAKEPLVPAVTRIKSKDLLQQMREIEIDHEGRIYRLRLTQLNKLILTA